MNMHPDIAGQFASERRRDMLAQARKVRLAREARACLTARRAGGAQSRTARMFRWARPVISSS